MARAGNLSPVTTLVERLGHPADAKLLIVDCRDLGQAHGANVAIFEALRTGLGTTAGLMVPCPWSRDAAARYRGEDVGVQLTLNSELERFRWGPITMSPSLIDGDGGFPRTIEDLWDHADLDELRRECRAQLERAVLWGFDVSHISSHFEALQQRPEFFDCYIDLACEYRLPVELPSAEGERLLGFPARALAADEGLVFPDHVVEVQNRAPRAVVEQAFTDLEPGVSLLKVSPALDVPEIRGLDPDWSRRVEDYLLVTHDASIRTLAERSGVTLIGYRELRQLLR